MTKILLYIIEVMILYTFTVFSKRDFCCEYEGITFRPGESIYPPGECKRLTCVGDAYFHTFKCPVLDKPNCYTYIDQEMPYPDCCLVKSVCCGRDNDISGKVFTECCLKKKPKSDGICGNGGAPCSYCGKHVNGGSYTGIFQ